MKIDNISMNVISQYVNAVKPAPKTQSAFYQESDSFEISDESRIMSEASRNLKAMMSDYDDAGTSARINRIKSELSRGVYNISPGDVADKILG